MDIEADTWATISEHSTNTTLVWWSSSPNVTNLNSSVNASSSSSSSSSLPMPYKPPELPDEVLIALYSVILLLSVVGNVLVIVTLIQNKGMRTVTNVLLMNLAVSDLLLGVFCMPFTLTDMLLRRFIFGAVMCKLLSYLQAVSVAVSVWTLVVISLERYFAICHPLRSRSWQTLSHAYKMIAVVWLMSFACMIPIVVLSELQPMNQGVYKCRERWPSRELELTFTIVLDILFLAVPLIIMATAYVEITSCLWQTIQIDKAGRQQALSGKNCSARHQTQVSTQGTTLLTRIFKSPQQIFNFSATSKTKLDAPKEDLNDSDQTSTATTLPSEDEQTEPEAPVQNWRSHMRHIRSTTNYDKSLAAKKRVIRMLFIIVLEFFICWTPLYVVSTGFFFGLRITPVPMACIYLLAYISSCCNPITYCFMNRKFRLAFLQAFGCNQRRFFRRGTRSSTNGASTFNRQSTIRTVVEDKETETQL